MIGVWLTSDCGRDEQHGGGERDLVEEGLERADPVRLDVALDVEGRGRPRDRREHLERIAAEVVGSQTDSRSPEDGEHAHEREGKTEYLGRRETVAAENEMGAQRHPKRAGVDQQDGARSRGVAGACIEEQELEREEEAGDGSVEQQSARASERLDRGGPAMFLPGRWLPQSAGRRARSGGRAAVAYLDGDEVGSPERAHQHHERGRGGQ